MFKEVIDMRERVPVLPRDGVQPSVIHHHAECAILLLHKEDRSSDGGLRRTNGACSQVVIDEFLQRSMLGLR